MQSSGRIKVKDLNTLLTCVLCNGYFVDATTISECLHSFCRTCIVSYLQSNKYCPICEVQVHKTRPLMSIRADQALQDIVYKVVPGLFKNEMKKRRDFYARADVQGKMGAIPVSGEKRGDVMGCERLIFAPEDIISISLEYCPPNLAFPMKLHAENGVTSVSAIPDVTLLKQKTHRRYLQCPGGLTVGHLKKLLRAKYSLLPCHTVDIMYMHDQLPDEYTLTDLAYIYSWRRNGPMRLFYKIHEKDNKRMKEIEPDLSRVVHVPICIISKPSFPSHSDESVSSSPGPSVGAAPASQFHLQSHPSPPRSPQMAVEPGDIKIANQNCAAMVNRPSDHIQVHAIQRDSLKTNAPKSRMYELENGSDHSTSVVKDAFTFSKGIRNISLKNGFNTRLKSVGCESSENGRTFENCNSGTNSEVANEPTRNRFTLKKEFSSDILENGTFMPKGNHKTVPLFHRNRHATNIINIPSKKIKSNSARLSVKDTL